MSIDFDKPAFNQPTGIKELLEGKERIPMSAPRGTKLNCKGCTSIC